MRDRIAGLNRHGLGLPHIQSVIERMGPLPGAKEFLRWLQGRFQVVVLSDTFYEFAAPLMAQLGWPTIFAIALFRTQTAASSITIFECLIRNELPSAAFKGLSFKDNRDRRFLQRYDNAARS